LTGGNDNGITDKKIMVNPRLKARMDKLYLGTNKGFIACSV